LGFRAIAATRAARSVSRTRGCLGEQPLIDRVFHRLLGSAPAGGCWSSASPRSLEAPAA